MVISVPYVAEPPVSGVHGVPGRDGAQVAAQLPYSGGLDVLLSPRAPLDVLVQRVLGLPVGRVLLPGLSPRVFRDEDCLGELVQPVHVNAGQERGYHAALGRAREGGVPFPVLDVPCLEHLFDQAQEPVIADLLPEDAQEH